MPLFTQKLFCSRSPLEVHPCLHNRRLCNLVRQHLGISCVLGLGLDSDYGLLKRWLHWSRVDLWRSKLVECSANLGPCSLNRGIIPLIFLIRACRNVILSCARNPRVYFIESVGPTLFLGAFLDVRL